MTMLRNFDTELDEVGTRPVVVKQTTRVVETVEVLPRPSEARSDVLKVDEEWGWEELRDYVVRNIEERFGPFPRDTKKEFGIFSSFVSRHGKQAAAIARHAFERCEGRWAGAPISVNRFCKNSDPYFAEVIVNRLVTEPVQGW